MRETTQCVCGSIKSHIIGSVQFEIRGKKIVVHDAPHFICEACNRRSFDSTTDIVSILKIAYKGDLNEISYFDEGFLDGVFAVPSKGIKVKVRSLSDYCDAKGVTPADLTKEELEQFLARTKDQQT
ncbi:YgiT-type zinc finger protein [Paenibacillus sp. S-38]|uniref:YgiT-type zinc finger protein n=1 Tax=Paenibacillus sp. S-38 TaxID=3416710 RepID=UPI003CF0217D